MACQNSCNSVPTPCCESNNGYLIILVLYILLAILLGSYFVC
ncbi:MAG: hypothetical protein PHE54_03455 [Bacilli bacterium]|nr:hypothetical protein [Bacilli bacterium]